MSEPATPLPPVDAESAPDGSGVLYAGLAYGMWGVLPLYWKLLSSVPAFELTVHRVLWCALFVAAVTAVRGHMGRIVAIFRDRRTLGMLALSSFLISVNWTLYIYCVAADRLVESALGYYMTPLVSFALGFMLFGERLSRLKTFAVALAGAAVVAQAVSLGSVPWISPGLALTFGIYGYLRKKAPVAALDGLLVETLLLLPFTAGLVGWWAFNGGAFPSPVWSTNALLLLAVPMTAVPLALFAAGARRVRMTTLGFLQYIAPSVTLMVAIFLFHEPFTPGDLISFGCVWAAIVIAAVDGGGLKFPGRTRA